MTFLESAIFVVKQSNNKSMTSMEIWKKIDEQKLINTNGKTPWASLNTILLIHSTNSNIKKRSKNPVFIIEEKSKPLRFSLILDNLNSIDNLNVLDEDIIETKTLIHEITSEKIDWKKLSVFNNNENIEYVLDSCEEYTYIIEDKIRDTIKIGKTKNDPMLRVNQLKTGNPSINLLMVFPSTLYSENELHNEYDDYRKDLEWFFYTKKLKSFIENELSKQSATLKAFLKREELSIIEREMIKHFL